MHVKSPIRVRLRGPPSESRCRKTIYLEHEKHERGAQKQQQKLAD